VALLAGIGSITTVAVSALLIGIAREVSLLWLPSGFRDIIAFGIVIVVLILLPHGLSGQTE
jgi:branched-subunit amino acid ABC-type transport system permease component